MKTKVVNCTHKFFNINDKMNNKMYMNKKYFHPQGINAPFYQPELMCGIFTLIHMSTWVTKMCKMKYRSKNIILIITLMTIYDTILPTGWKMKDNNYNNKKYPKYWSKNNMNMLVPVHRILSDTQNIPDGRISELEREQ